MVQIQFLFYSSCLSSQTKYLLVLFLSHSLFSASLSLTLVLLFQFCESTLPILSTIYITQILVSFIFISISLTNYLFIIFLSPSPSLVFIYIYIYIYLFLSLFPSPLGTNNKERIKNN